MVLGYKADDFLVEQREIHKDLMAKYEARAAAQERMASRKA